MLDPVAELGQDTVRYIPGILRAEIDADSLGTDELDHLLYFLKQGFRRVVEQKVRFIKEEHHLRLGGIAHFGQLLEQLGEHPQKESGIEPSVIDQALAVQDIDHALAAFRRQPVTDIEAGLAEEHVAAVDLKRNDSAEDRRDRSRAHLSVLSFELAAVPVHIIEHGLKILRIDQEQSVVVSDLEHDGKDIGLQLVELHDAGQEHGTHFRDRRPQLYAVLPVDIPEGNGISLISEAVLRESETLDPRLHVFAVDARRHHAGDVALDVSQEHRNAHVAECFSHDP